MRLGPINYKVQNYRVNSNNCLCGQVDKEEDYRARGCSPGNLGFDPELIPTQAFSSQSSYIYRVDEHTKSPQKFDHGKVPKFSCPLKFSVSAT